MQARRAWLLLVSVLLAGVGPLHAQQITSPYEFVEDGQVLGPRAAYIVTNQGTLNLGPHSGMGYSAHYSLRLGGPFNLDAGLMVLPTTRTVMDTVPGDSAVLVDDPLAGVQELGEHDLGIAVVTGALRFDVTGPRTYRRLQPYVIFGGGLKFQLWDEGIQDVHLIDANRFEFGGGFVGEIGGGIEWFVTDRLTLRLDARDMFWKLNIPEAFQRLNVPEDEWVQNLNASLGIGLRF